MVFSGIWSQQPTDNTCNKEMKMTQPLMNGTTGKIILDLCNVMLSTVKMKEQQQYHVVWIRTHIHVELMLSS